MGFRMTLYVRFHLTFLLNDRRFNPAGSYACPLHVLQVPEITEGQKYNIFTIFEKRLHFIDFIFVFTDNFVRERINGELEKLKHNVHRILSDQQQDFARAFGLHGELSSSEASLKTRDIL